MNGVSVSVFVVLVFCTIFHSPPRISGENVVVVDDTLRIDCGSSTNTSIGKRVFGADPKSSETASIFVTTNSLVSSQLYRTARVFTEASGYRFRVRKQGRYLIRLYFFPFADRLYDLSVARFSVAAQNLSLSEELRVEKGPAVVKEYWLNITSEALLLTLSPFKNSFAFINAIEVILVPGDLFPDGSPVALETVYRLNMGNESVSPENDTLWRSWLADGPFLLTQARFASNTNSVVAGAESAAPKPVYGTASEIDLARDTGYANISWKFTSVAPRFEYLLRFHFCNLGNENEVAAPKKPLFSLYVNSELVSSYGDRPEQRSDSVGVPYYVDTVVKATHRDGDPLFVTVGPRSVRDSVSPAFLNGLEIMKLAGSLSSSDGTTAIAAPKRKLVIVVVIVVSAAGLFIVAVSALCLFRCRRRRRRGGKVAEVVEEAGGVFSGAEIAYRFPLSAIREATEGFSEEMVIGAGGFGRVYKGVLGEEGTAVAIKRGYTESTHGLTEFRTEIEMLSQFRHRHLVSLIGYCDEQGEMIVIYEHVDNGTLKERLYDNNEPLTFRQRLQICIGSARALHYLHTGTAKPIIHRDVKTANILLDRNLVAKVADFGLSKAGPAADETHVTTAVKGSFGYLDPEYLILQRLTQKSDVYSFGVVMLEVLCGRAVVDPSLPRDEANLVDWAMKRRDEGRVSYVVDPRLVGQVSPESLAKLWETVEKCLAGRGALRPSMGDVLWNLETVLRLQGAEESRVCVVGENVLTETATDITAVSLGDLSGISMSKVFAQMVKEDVE